MMHPNTLKVLHAIDERGQLTMAQIDALALDISGTGSKGSLASLKKAGLIEADRVDHYPAYYSVTKKGKHTLLVLSGTQDKGDMPAPREVISSANYTGTKWRIRAGADDHLKHLSRRGDDYVEHRAPIPMAGFCDAVGVHGGRI